MNGDVPYSLPKLDNRKLAALSRNDKTSSQWLEDGGRRGWTHPLFFVIDFVSEKSILILSLVSGS